MDPASIGAGASGAFSPGRGADRADADWLVRPAGLQVQQTAGPVRPEPHPIIGAVRIVDMLRARRCYRPGLPGRFTEPHPRPERWWPYRAADGLVGPPARRCALSGPGAGFRALGEVMHDGQASGAPSRAGSPTSICTSYVATATYSAGRQLASRSTLRRFAIVRIVPSAQAGSAPQAISPLFGASWRPPTATAASRSCPRVHILFT